MLAIFPELIELAQRENTEYLSVRIRQYFGGDVAKKPMVDMDQVIEGLGIPTKTVELGYPAALAAEDEDGAFKVGIFFDVTVNGVQRRFLQAHMLGHFFFEYQSQIASGDLKKSGYKETVLPLNRYVSGLGANPNNPVELAKEALCDKFAAALLMPKGMLIKVFSVLGDINKVAEIFGVTPDTVQQRLSDLGASIGGDDINMEAERRLRGVGAHANPDHSQVVSSDDVSRLNAPQKQVSVIKDNQAKEFAKSVAEENMLAMKSMNSQTEQSRVQQMSHATQPADNRNRQTLGSDRSVSEPSPATMDRPVKQNFQAPEAPSTESGEGTLKKLRRLASMIDSSVRPD
ncbi:ImmA/IrrE family metallo-endopeptidase [bacterium]|nr:ImmA/IrrE family metallo-endopeptidase [bacterium]